MQQLNLNKTPYHDDWDPAKRFSKILFRPSPIKVQTRELNQVQSIMLDQVEKIGNHLFKEGSVVIPGGLTITNTPIAVKFLLAGGTDFSDLENIPELYLVSKASGTRCRVLELTRVVTEADTMECIMELVDAGNDVNYTFKSDDDLYFNSYDANDVEIRVGYGRILTTSGAIMARMTQGVYYIRGMFLSVDSQTLVVSKTSNTSSHRVGFNVTENIITEDDDPSLYSNAQGTPNAKAPGAHRLRIDLALAAHGYDDVVDDFVELAKVRDGKIQSMVTQSTYNVLEDTLAQRTYEQAGDYNVVVHQLDLREHLKVGDNGGVYTAEEGGDESKMVAVMKPGISYVRGRRVQNLGEERVVIDKARDTDALNNNPVAVPTGNYLTTKTSKGVPVVSKTIRYKLLNAAGVSQGTALCISAERSGSEFRVYMRDIVWTGDRTTLAKISYEEGGVVRFISDLVSNQFTLASSQDLIFELPMFGIRTLVPGGDIDINYTVIRSYRVTLNAQGQGSISAPLGYSFSPEFALYAGAKSDGTVAQVDVSSALSLSGSPVGSALNINLSAGSANMDISIMAVMVRTTATIRTKTLTTATQSLTFTAATVMNLANTDCMELLEVKNSLGVDVTSNFALDGGQRDAGYYVGTLSSKVGALTGVFTVKYAYYAHSAGDFFSVDSYNSTPYQEIPLYTSSSSGMIYGLSDSIDFRPNIVGGVADAEIVRPNTTVILDAEYYLPRIDAVYVAESGVFGVTRGISSNNLVAPTTPNNSMRLYELTIPPYTANIDAVQTKPIDNRRYTMRDIGALEKRIENVEYYTTLSQLESSAMTQQVFDPATGMPRFKNGIAADPFKDFRLIDDLSDDWMGSIDSDNGRLRPYVQQNVIDMGTDWATKDGVVVCKYTVETSVIQNYATTTINVNPYAVFNWAGYIKLNPNTDYWFENYYVAPRIINETINTRGAVKAGSVYGTWRTVSVGERVWAPHGRGGNWYAFRYLTTISERSVVTTTLTDTTTTKMTGEKIVETQVIPYMRPSQVRFTAEGLRPFTRMYPFFTGRNVSAYCQQDGLALGAPLVSNANGVVSGVFNVPRNTTIRFNTGDNVFRLSDNALDSRDKDETRTSAEAVHKSFGKSQGIQKTFVNTRVLGYTVSKGTQTSQTDVVLATWRDPIAESFMVASPREGEYIDSVDVYFSTKSRDVPITMEIREMENGNPAETVVTRKLLNPAQVSVSANSSVATRFTFDFPVFLAAGKEFAIVLLANTQDYNAYIAEMGKKNLLSNEFIAKQPYTGVFFTSSNGSTWTPNQMSDMKFKVNRCRFAAADNVVTFTPKAGPQARPLGSSELSCIKSSATITVYAPGHGLVAGNTVVLAGLTGGCSFTPAELNRSHVVTDSTFSTFKIVLAHTADSNGAIGGDEGTFLGNYLVSMFYASITNTVVEGSSMTLEYRYRDAVSNAMMDWVEFEADTDVFLPTEGIYRQRADFQVRATCRVSPTNPFIAPQIDTDDFTIILNSFGVDPFEDDFRYVTKDIGFDSPCTTAKFYLGALLPSQSSVKLQVKLLRQGDTMDKVAWVDVPSKSALVNDGANFFEYEYDLTTAVNNPFIGLKARLLVRGSRVVPPSFKDFRLIALA